MFLEARPADGSPADVIIQGAPYDGGTAFRAGSSRAPEQVRAFSDGIESWSPRLKRDLLDIDIADAGDLQLAGLPAEQVMDVIAQATEAHARTGALVVTLGGDHSVSIGTSRGLRAVYPDLVHLVYDAHMDLRPEYDGSQYSHACGTNHMAAAGATCVLGVRSGSREEWMDAEKLLTAFSEDLEIPAAFKLAMAGKPLFVSLDLDVLDPSILPGTGNPEPGGPFFRELREALLSLAGHRIVGLDVVEVHPDLDASGVSSTVAAALVRDLTLAYARPGA